MKSAAFGMIAVFTGILAVACIVQGSDIWFVIWLVTASIITGVAIAERDRP